MLQCRAEINERDKVPKCVTRTFRSVSLCGVADFVVFKKFFCFRTIEWTKPNSMKCPPHCIFIFISISTYVFYRKAMDKRSKVIMTWSLSSKNAYLLCLCGAINWMLREPNNTNFQGIIWFLLKSYIPSQVLIFFLLIFFPVFCSSDLCTFFCFSFLFQYSFDVVVVAHFVLVHFNNFIVHIA